MSWLSSESLHPDPQILWRIDSIGVAVTVVHERKVLYYDFQQITLFTSDDRHQYDQLLHHTQMCINRMIPKILEYLQTPPRQVMVVIGEPWAHSIRRHIIYKRKTPFKLTKGFVDDLITRDMKKLVQEYRHDAVEFISPTHHGISIAGHIVSDPWGKSVNDIRFDYVTGFSDAQMIEMVEQVIHEKLKVPLLHIYIDHYQNSLMQFWKKTNISGGLLVDATGFVTDLYIFHNNQLMQVGTIPSGISTIHQTIADKMGMYPSELRALLGLYKKNIINDSVKVRIQKLLQESFHVWESDFQRFCNHAVEQGDIIDRVIWIGKTDDVILNFFIHTLQNDGLKFPIIFGTNQVGFLHSDAIIDTIDADLHTINIQNQDRIILAGLE